MTYANSIYEMIVGLGDTYSAARKKAEQEAALQGLLANTPPGTMPDMSAMGAALLGAGDVRGAMTAAQLAQAQADRTFQRQVSERDFGFRKQQAEAENKRDDETLSINRANAAIRAI